MYERAFQEVSGILSYYIGKSINKLIRISMRKGGKYFILNECIRSNFTLKKQRGLHLKEILPSYAEQYSPRVVLRTVKIAGNTYHVPYELTKSKQFNLFLKNLKRLIETMSIKGSYSKVLVKETDALLSGQSELLREKEKVHRKAESGSAYLHYRW